MGHDGTDYAAVAQYVVEIDGNKHSEHVHFADAIKQGLLLRCEHPQSRIRVRDLSKSSTADMKTDVAA